VTHQLIISRLIESGYQVFIPVSGGSEILLRSLDGRIQRCRARTASIDANGSSVLRISEGFDLIAVYDPVTKNVWGIPSEVLKGLTAIRLGKKWDDYLIPEPRSIEYKNRKASREEYLEALRDQARKKGEQL